jgi:rubrerythrin
MDDQESPSAAPERRGPAGLFMRLLRRSAPERAAAAEQESREWYLVCRKCGNERTYADVGAVRFGAYSKGKVTGFQCPVCDKFRLHKVERRRTPDHDTAPGPG